MGTILEPFAGSGQIAKVSIQLMSPASGDETISALTQPQSDVSIQLMSPASGDLMAIEQTLSLILVSIQLMSPASGDTSILNPYPARCPETVSKGQKKKC